jgi:hypothetical protein
MPQRAARGKNRWHFPDFRMACKPWWCGRFSDLCIVLGVRGGVHIGAEPGGGGWRNDVQLKTKNSPSATLGSTSRMCLEAGCDRLTGRWRCIAIGG